ncbi:MAG TPA: DUF1850 domain-containing protein [Candidatus Deferrimicrobiaceae bacterium]|nr:DUF1850 domain-containing protein [Candidatus Deferrimicrobiaceae bacterium]
MEEAFPDGIRPGHGPDRDAGHTRFRYCPISRGNRVTLLLASACLMALLAGGICRAGERIVVSGRTAQRVFDLSGNTFTLSWIHSVERTEWRETFSVDPTGRMSLAASEFSSGGAGLPGMPNADEVVRLGNGVMRLTGSRLALDDLKVGLSDLSRHYLRTEGHITDLNAIFGEGTISIRVEKPREGENDAKEE